VKKGHNVIDEILIPIGIALAIVIYLSLDLGMKHGLKAALISALVFGVICGGLCLTSFLLYRHRQRLNTERKKEAGEIEKKIKPRKLLTVSLILILIGVIMALVADIAVSLVAVAFSALFVYCPRFRQKREKKF